ncbi:MAG: PilZ domain-containing protein [Myxococcales bacterium]|nr:PilZ domain-containing protein [Myxococcales bacterium]
MRAVDELSFEELVEELALLSDGSGGDPVRAVRLAGIERRLLALVGGAASHHERRSSIRMPGDLPMRLHIAVEGRMRDLGEGGLRVTLPVPPPDDEPFDVELLPGPGLPPGVDPPRATAVVAWKRALSYRGYDVGLRFVSQSERQRRDIRRLVIELLRRLSHRR